MKHKLIIIADPGIDTAFAIALALYDPDLEVLGLAASAGNVSATQATKNIQILVEHFDPPRWPRFGAALPAEYGIDGTKLHGPDGLAGLDLPCADLHHQHSSDKLIVDLVRQHPKDITIVALGPLTVLARAFDRDPELPGLVHRLVCVGGAWHEPGNASPTAEFHFYCDPHSARQVLKSGVPLTILPLDVARKLLFTAKDLLELPADDSRTCHFLRKILPFAIRATSNLYGIEGFHLKDVLGIIAVSAASAIGTRSFHADVETRGELTRGMTVLDARANPAAPANADWATSLDQHEARAYIQRILSLAT